MHSYNECVRRGTLYQVSEKSDKCAFCLEHSNESYFLIVTNADWRPTGVVLIGERKKCVASFASSAFA